MKADPGQQWKLLDLAALDTRAAQVAHRRNNLPEAAQTATAQAEHDALFTELVRTRTARSDAEREVAKAESDTQLVRDRLKRTTARLDDGSASSRELQGVQSELESLERRAGVLEDEQNLVEERLAALGERLERLAAAEPEAAGRLEEARAAERTARSGLDEAERTIDRSRSDLVGGIGPALLNLYERIRSQSGMGAAALTARRCGGCNLELLGADLRRVATAADDEVVRCENCGRILVRTSESEL